MASSLALKRFFSSALLSRSLLLRPVASSACRSFNTNAMRHYDQHSDDDRKVDVDRRSFPRTRRDDLLLSDVFDPFSPPRSLSQVLNMVDLLTDNPVLSSASRRGWNARETEDALLLRLDMPGLGKEDVKISVEQNTLTIKGEEGAKESEEEEESGRRFSSRIDLPEKLYKIDEIKAEMKNGVLKVIVPKMKEQERNNVINVKVD
ncbi:heat shock 22 kDa protein, mitochondrial-like [Vicia villosa]|uniref:heat shock 22 kDa protein, mitochondrial-like n=1 Tax=Vicia villosa TaxID=3911 RepID=UPI00273B9D8F|nr:heat shock 22 kDa protein, mitochondrial-like [Vicia villosa]